MTLQPGGMTLQNFGQPLLLVAASGCKGSGGMTLQKSTVRWLHEAANWHMPMSPEASFRTAWRRAESRHPLEEALDELPYGVDAVVEASMYQFKVAKSPTTCQREAAMKNSSNPRRARSKGLEERPRWRRPNGAGSPSILHEDAMTSPSGKVRIDPHFDGSHQGSEATKWNDAPPAVAAPTPDDATLMHLYVPSGREGSGSGIRQARVGARLT